MKLWSGCVYASTAVVLLLLPTTIASPDELRVDARQTRLHIANGGVQLVLAIPWTDPMPLPVTARAELIDAWGTVLATGSKQMTLGQGDNRLRVALEPLERRVLELRARALKRQRVEYRIEPDDADAGPAATGVIPAMNISAAAFELMATHSSFGLAGEILPISVLAFRNDVGSPVPGVTLEAELPFDGGDEVLHAVAVTGADGVATLELPLHDFESSQMTGEVTIVGRKDDFEVSLDQRVEIFCDIRVITSTDKPLYRPGETLHVRFLLRDGAGRSMDDKRLRVTITNPERQRLVRHELTTSRFGIASFDWPIPESARLGEYEIAVDVDVPGWEGHRRSFFQVSRYELPAFEVSVETSESFHLPGEDAEVRVRADYVFGEPVASGHVRIADEDETLAEAELGDDGTVSIAIALSDFHEDLADSRYRRYRDVELAAYVTDASTGRTEPRKFTVRVSKEPIHVYLIDSWYRARPSRLYVSTFRADGEPIACDVTVESVSRGVPWHRHVRTNRYGVAEVGSLRGALEDGAEIVITARDENGLEGQAREDLYLDDRPGVDVRLQRTIHRPGEDIVAEIRGPSSMERVAVALARDWDFLDVQVVSLYRGKGRAVFRYDERFRGALGVVAFDPGSTTRYYADVLGSHPAFYPYERELRVAVTADQERYQPGSPARLAFTVTKPDGSPVEAALGVAITDRALEERMRTVLDFEASRWRRWYYRNGNDFFNYQTLGKVNERDLRRLDPETPVSPELDLVAEILFRHAGSYPYVNRSRHTDWNVVHFYRTLITDELQPVVEAIDRRFSGGRYPVSEESLGFELADEGIVLDRFLDPWGRPFRTELRFVGPRVRMSIVSNGADGKARTSDDLVGLERSWKYFGERGNALTDALMDYEHRHGKKVLDEASLEVAAAAAGIELERLRDPWGRRVRFTMGIDRGSFSIVGASAGPDGRFARRPSESGDDIRLWRHRYPLFPLEPSRLERLLARQRRFPGTDEELVAVLASGGIVWSELRDLWGTPFLLEHEQETLGRVHVRTIRVRSAGPDRRQNSGDDLIVAELDRRIRQPEPRRPVDADGDGAVSGRVTDEDGGVLPGTTVTLENEDTGASYRAVTDERGEYVVAGLPRGVYTLRIELAGFVPFRREGLELGPSVVLVQDVSLDVGGMAESVTVTGESPAVETASASVASTLEAGSAPASDILRPIATPRLREYFPETLVWEPELLTGDDGKTTLSFDFADNVTTWKLSVIASTVDGELGRADDELVSFQPFFIEYEPPKVLTEGDVISQPVVLRNYEETPLRVDLTFVPDASLELRSEPNRHTAAPARSFAEEVFVLHARRTDAEARAQITARSPMTSDAIVKSTVIVPDGREHVSTEARFLRREVSLPLEFPADAIPGTKTAELSILPNLVSHVVASVDDIMRRPYGCAEQTVSSGYPSLLLTRYVKRTGSTEHVSPQLLARAERYIELAYQRLAGYQERAGGFSYWGGGRPDVALTAYVLRFLGEAREVIDVDDRLYRRAVRWLVNRQRDDGSWTFSGWYGARSEAHAWALTATAAHTLARADRAAAARARAFLERRLDAMEEPYAVAATALAALEVDDTELARKATERLVARTTTRDRETFWRLDGVTPYRGWGRAGDVETTALAVRALAVAREKNLDVPDRVLDGGLHFLLANKDRYGIWFSTQATVRSAEALLSVLDAGPSTSSPGPGKIDVFADGELVQTVKLSGLNPIRLDLGEHVGDASITLRGAGLSGEAMAELVTTHYEPWTSTARTASGENLRLSVGFSETEVPAGGELECTVELARIGDSGRGMLLAEIGLPPAVEVDRGSLEKARGYETGLYQYDVLPDRVIAYVWPRKRETSFSFKFRPRLAMHAKSGPSRVYDYYNPDAAVVLPPESFVVR